MLQYKVVKTRNWRPCSLLVGRVRWPLKWMRVGIDWRVGLDGWLWWSAHPLVVLFAGIMQSTLLLLLASQKQQLGFGLFVSVVHNLLQL